jgi:hypothetical protein
MLSKLCRHSITLNSVDATSQWSKLAGLGLTPLLQAGTLETLATAKENPSLLVGRLVDHLVGRLEGRLEDRLVDRLSVTICLGDGGAARTSVGAVVSSNR